MTFNLKESQIYRAIAFEKMLPSGFFKLIRLFVWIIFSICTALAAASLLLNQKIGFDGWQGLAMMFGVLGISMSAFRMYGQIYLRDASRRNPDNLADALDFESALMISRSSDINGFLNLLLDYGDIGWMTARLPELISIQKQIKSSQNISWATVVEAAFEQSKSRQDYLVSPYDILCGFFDTDNDFKNSVFNNGLTKEDLMEVAFWYRKVDDIQKRLRRFWSLENLLRVPPIGREWAYGYLPLTMSFAVNLTDKATSEMLNVRLWRRDKEIDEIEEILSRSREANILIAGEPGVGRKTLIMDFVRRVAQGQSTPLLNYKKIFDLNLVAVVGAAKSPTDIQNFMTGIFDEIIKAGDGIVLIKNFHDFSGEKSGITSVDMSELLVPYLTSNRIQVIALTDTASFHKIIESKPALANAFERIQLEEPSITDAVKILEEQAPAFETESGVSISYSGLKKVADAADKYIQTAPFPEKGLNLLSEVLSYSSSKGKRVMEPEDVDLVVSRRTGIPLGPIAGSEKDKLQNLETLMKQELVGQERAIEVVSSTMRRLRSGLSRRGRPAGVFLFVGPTGVGKTQTSKILAKIYFGSEDKMVRFDMSEYQEMDSIEQFIGSAKMNEPGQFTTKVKDNPFSLILLDEIEKANRDLLNIFLQVFDEGHLTDAFGHKISLEQNIIIATSNAGADFIREQVLQGIDPSKEKNKLIDVMIKGNYFRPELLNRFDEIVIFHPLNKGHIHSVAELLMKELIANLEKQGYIFRPNPELIDHIGKLGFDPQFGARPMQRVIRDKLENLIAKKIIDGTLKKGQEFTISVSEISS